MDSVFRCVCTCTYETETKRQRPTKFIPETINEREIGKWDVEIGAITVSIGAKKGGAIRSDKLKLERTSPCFLFQKKICQELRKLMRR